MTRGICPSQGKKDLCFRLFQYREGGFNLVFHEHIKGRRASQSSVVSILRSLVIRGYGRSGMGFEQIVSCFLNSRPGDRRPDRALDVSVEYPADGLIRKICGGNTQAWVDQWLDNSKTPLSL